ncbi:ABC-2 type transport system permease protein [Cerasibacillus quisquiliarum]|uniref:hypothetical protein n=1 Tax=Cerasibacillus quisquiliarum TaxID=227865 RepID=UPI0011BDB1BA|nr:hypothetical protein [Cerasibacillus quisquiliarum]MBB5146247.1 ABC-2 type transport system permease protein [Cerasibacillus quisquiliarum]
MQYVYIFNKQNVYNKIGFFWFLALPILFFFIRFNAFKNNNMDIEMLNFIHIYWGFMLLTTVLSGVLLAIIQYRDSGFLKSFTFLSGNKHVIIFGKLLSQLLYIVVLTTVFNLIISVVYKIDFSQLFLKGLLTMLIAFIPICFSMLWMVIIPVNANNIAPIGTILLILFLYLANFGIETHSYFLYFMYSLNPVVYLSNILNMLNDFSFEIVIINALTTLIYLIIGFFSLKNMSIIPRKN